MKVSYIFLALCLVTFASCIQKWDNGFLVDQLVQTPNGPSFIAGELGRLQSVDNNGAQAYINKFVRNVYELSTEESFELIRTETDSAGMVHLHYTQKIRNLIVDLSRLSIHVNPHTKFVFAITASVSKAAHLPENVLFTIGEVKQSLIHLVPTRESFELVSLEQIYVKFDGNSYLAYKADIKYTTLDNTDMRSTFYINALDNTLIVELNRYFNALDRIVYSADNTQRLPGPSLVRTEGSAPTLDTAANNAYQYTGVCYDFYFTKFGRDSYDNRGATMISTVHYGNNYNNAFWNSEQMVFGDGDGVTFDNFAGDLSVVCHELTHAVVEFTAGLIYYRESGALNEGFADIMGASANMYNEGSTGYDWDIGAVCYTPNIPGDALRYMNNPPLDGSSYDYYPDRYTGFLDNGGVHWNSGIANLAYVLLTQGGVHPQEKTSIYVNGIGLEDAELVFYDTLSNYLGPESQFADARASSVVAARTRFGNLSQQASSTDDAWAAVGVPETSV